MYGADAQPALVLRPHAYSAQYSTPQPVASVPGGLEYNVFSSYNPEGMQWTEMLAPLPLVFSCENVCYRRPGLALNAHVCLAPTERKQDNEEASSSSNNDKGEGLRQRGAGEGAEEKKSEGDEKATQDKAEPARKKSVNNPLRWFGVLVPMPLRNAQADFKNGMPFGFVLSPHIGRAVYGPD